MLLLQISVESRGHTGQYVSKGLKMFILVNAVILLQEVYPKEIMINCWWAQDLCSKIYVIIIVYNNEKVKDNI